MTEGLAEVTTVADDEIVVHVPPAPGNDDGDGTVRVVRLVGLDPESDHDVEGVRVRTLARPPGERLATVATVNDVHFGEVECGVIEGLELGPVLRVGPGEPPYPETMNRAAVTEIAALGPDALVAKGDLTTHGTEEEFRTFLDHYRPAFGDRLHYVRGNHDAYRGATFASDAPVEVPLPGVILAILDTAVPGLASGRVSAEQLDWLDELGRRADRPVLVFGHHHPWAPGSPSRPEGYFGIHPDDSERLVEVVARRARLVGYFAGHTHRNRVRRFPATGPVPWVEVASVKDFPGSWAEYRVFEGGILQVHRRISSPEALDWSERTRALFGGMYPSYAFGRAEDRCFAISAPPDH
jgi:predicted phosphodiesterase